RAGGAGGGFDVGDEGAGEAAAAEGCIDVDVGQLGVGFVALNVGNEPQTGETGGLAVELADIGSQDVPGGLHTRGDLLGSGAHAVEKVQEARQVGRIVRCGFAYGYCSYWDRPPFVARAFPLGTTIPRIPPVSSKRIVS